MRTLLVWVLVTTGVLGLGGWAGLRQHDIDVGQRAHLVQVQAGYHGVKSFVPGSGDGHYVGGVNGGRRGSHYVNPYTGNHYRNRKAGVPY